MTEQKKVHTRYTLPDPEAAVAVSSIVSIIDTEGYITWVNDSFCRICRCTANELIGRRHSILEHLLQTKDQSASILNTIQKGESWKGELQYLMVGGAPIRTYSTIVPMRGAAGEISQYIIICEDITGRKAPAETHIEPEKRFQNLIGNDAEAAFITDLEGNILKANKRGEAVANLTQEALQGMRFLDLLSAGDQQKIRAALPLVLEGQDLQFRAALNRFDIAFSAVVAITPVLEEGKTSHFFVRFQNISAEDNNEKDLKLLNEITQALSAAPSLKKGMALVIAELCAYGDFQYGEFWRPLFDQPLVSMKSCWGGMDKFHPLEAAAKGRVFNILADRSEILSNSKCFYAADLGTYKSFSRKAEATACGLHSLLSIPIIYRKKFQGVFLLFSASKCQQPSVDPDRLQALLNKLGGELERNKTNVELDRFFDLSPELMSIIGFDGYTKKSNLAFRHLHGYSDEETESSMAMSFVHPDDLPKAADAWEKIIQGHPVRNLELRYRCKDGSYRWLSCATQSFPEDRLLYLTAHDITDQKLQLQELVKLSTAIRHSINEVYIISPENGYFSYVNERALDNLGYTPAEIETLTPLKVNPDYAQFSYRK
ncbi:MAG: PAS domain S-box protein, partial [Bacteroidetes bacterium]|nr:PAS domain S-box protein [Bacteroidota bacterium]